MKRQLSEISYSGIETPSDNKYTIIKDEDVRNDNNHEKDLDKNEKDKQYFSSVRVCSQNIILQRIAT